MRRVGELLGVGGLTLSLALGATACSSSREPDGTECTGAVFASPKGGPGSIQMRAYPTFNRNFGDAREMTVTGMVESGNDAGTKVVAGNQYGEFGFTWNPSSTSLQKSVVALTVQFEGERYNCSSTELQFNPQDYTVTPHLPGAPF